MPFSRRFPDGHNPRRLPLPPERNGSAASTEIKFVPPAAGSTNCIRYLEILERVDARILGAGRPYLPLEGKIPNRVREMLRDYPKESETVIGIALDMANTKRSSGDPLSVFSVVLCTEIFLSDFNRVHGILVGSRSEQGIMVLKMARAQGISASRAPARR